MSEQGTQPARERSSTTGPGPGASIPAPEPGVDPPTVVRSSSASGSNPHADGDPASRAPAGSSRNAVVHGTGSSVRKATGITPLPAIGETVGTFELQEAIGVGGMGAVFRARDTMLDRMVALKLLPPDMARDPEAIPRFYQEGRAAARLDHENIARVFSIGHDGGLHFIAFEFILGTTIRQKVERDGVLSEGEAIEITLQVAEALVHASARGVVHRDVKPSNIIITPEGRAKLVDMGLARHFERGGDAGLTQTGVTLGTFDYISPEQARDPRDVDVRGDLYSLGCTLFFMLSGRPPFPEGTVLQKLIKHQEEPPPDIRTANPLVSSGLASVLAKLMDKDRERRHQTPEHLARDLMNVAALLGIAPRVDARALWPAPKPPPAWERHLVWAVPAVAVVLLLIGLIVLNTPPSTDVRGAGAAIADAGGPRLKQFGKPNVAPLIGKKEASGEPVRPVGAALAREIAVKAGDDLVKIMTEAPPKSTILLIDEGPYTVRPAARGESSRLSGLDLTVRADLGLRPVVRLAKGVGETPEGGASLFDLKGGRLTLESLDLVVELVDGAEPTAAIQAEDVDLTLTRCVVRRSVIGTKGTGRGVALRLRASNRSPGDLERRATATLVDACHVDAGLTALQADGPVEVAFRDDTFGPALGATFDLRNPDGNVPASVHLRHVSVMLGVGPAFACSGLPPRVRAAGSVFAPGNNLKGTLVELDDPVRLDWRGLDNLYGRIGLFLQPKRGSQIERPGLTTFDAWADDPGTAREFGSVAVATQVWDDPDAARALGSEANGDPSRCFKLAEARPGLTRSGARQGPLGPLALPTKIAADARPSPTSPEDARAAAASASGFTTSPLVSVNPFLNAGPDLAVRPMSKGPAEPEKGPGSTPVSAPGEADDAGDMPEMPVMPPMTLSPGPKPTDAVAKTAATPAVDPGAIRTAVDFVEAIRKGSAKGETIRVPADADWELAACEIVGDGSWTIRAEPGATRPRLRFRPSPNDLAALKEGARAVWLKIPTGSLRLEGIDVVVPADVAPKAPGCAAFLVGSGGDLSLTDCSVTVEGDRTAGVAILVAAEGGENAGEAEAPAATVRLKNCLMRSGGDLVDVASGRPLDLELDNVVVATAGGLLHGHGATRTEIGAALKLTLLQVSARVAGGIVRLDSRPDAPELPNAVVVARNSIFATNALGDPLVRVDGQDDVDTLRDRVRWDGHNVAYHRISTYRRDQVRKSGTRPTLFDRASWEVAVGRREASPIHDDLKFETDWDDERTIWSLTPDDLRLKADSPAAKSGSGADLTHIPSPAWDDE